jgi:hypothetical protein
VAILSLIDGISDDGMALLKERAAASTRVVRDVRTQRRGAEKEMSVALSETQSCEGAMQLRRGESSLFRVPERDREGSQVPSAARTGSAARLSCCAGSV